MIAVDTSQDLCATGDGRASLACVPPALRERTQWVCWGSVLRGGKPTKVPFNARTRSKADSTDPSTWSTFDEAVAAWQTNDGYAGIGFVFAVDDPYSGIDLDDCIAADGKLVPSAQEVVDRFNTYTEISPSGAGVKMILVGCKPHGAKCRSKLIKGFKATEVYSHGRFFTVTGRHLSQTPLTVEHRQDQLTALCARLWPCKASPVRISRDAGVIAGFAGDDAALIATAQAAANGEKFSSLWRGETSAHNCDDSAADLAVCSILAFWTAGDAARMDRLFRQSGLMRPKWDEQRGATTYGERTIRAALEGLTEVYHPPRAVHVAGNGDRARLDGRARLLTDIGNAARLVRQHGKNIRYCHDFGRWYFWNETHWRADDQGRVVELCKQTALSIYDEAKKADGEAQKAITRWALASQRRDRLTAMAALAQPDVAVTPDDLDAHGWLLNCANGTIDLRRGKSQPHRREDLITRVLAVEFVPDASCPQFEWFLQEIFRGDQELIRHVQNWHGYCLTSDVREQFLYVYLGGGANGKSVLLDTICEVMGLYAAEAPPDLLTLRKHPEHPTEIADLCGRRLVIASETEREAVLRLQLIKRLTGNAQLKGRWMRQDYFEFPRTHKTILVTNNPPLIPEHTEAAERRLQVVPFAYTVPEAQRDPHLLHKFRLEHAGILAWLVRGCLQWQVEGLPQVPAMSAAKRRLLGEINSLECFIRERCVLREREQCESAELHAEYTGWCQEHGRRQVNAPEMASVLRRHDCEGGKSQGRRCWFGIGLVPLDSGHDGHNGHGFPIEQRCSHHEGVNGKVASTASSVSNETPLESLYDAAQAPRHRWA